MALTQLTLPQGISRSDLDGSGAINSIRSDEIYIGQGSLIFPADDTNFADKNAVKTLLESTTLLGDAAEKPFKLESKVEKLKTRSKIVEGRRTNTIEVRLAGITNKQKALLESGVLNSGDFTIIGVTVIHDQCLVINGLKWTYEFTGESDNLFSATLSAEFAGATDAKIRIYDKISAPTTP